MYTSKIFTILYYLGIVSCGIQGAEKVAPEKMESYFTSMVRVCVSALLNSFGGGLIRDLLLWTPPALFSVASIPDVCLAICFAFLYLYIVRKVSSYRTHLDCLAILCDSIGVGTFIMIGVGRAFDFSVPVMVLSGTITALFGGMMACLYNNIPFHLDLYKLIVMSGALFYTLLIANDMNMHISQSLLCSYIFVATILSYSKVWMKITNLLYAMISALLTNYIEPFVSYAIARAINYKKTNYYMQNVNNSYIRQKITNFSFLYIRLCRLRQM